MTTCDNHDRHVLAWRDGLCRPCWIEAEPYLYPNHSQYLED